MSPDDMEVMYERELRATRRAMARVGATALLGFGTFTAMASKLGKNAAAADPLGVV